MTRRLSLPGNRLARTVALATLGAITSTAIGQQTAPAGPGDGDAVAAPPAPGQSSENAPNDADFEPLEQGPIHEAFASPIGEAGGVAEDALSEPIDQAPPEPVNELPPAERPEGANVQWIPGYWMWEESREDFVWVSGVWRQTPPGRQWTPGSWVEVDGGYAWSPGFWSEADAQQVNYLPAPPETLEEGPSSPAPSEQHFWVPGCWVYQQNDYQWRTGYWYRGQPGWVWTPSYYSRTPRGYVYVNGYWDVPLARRGVLYAPVYWPSAGYGPAGYAYRPRSVVNTSLLITSLFVNPNRGHYYYGNYGPRYRSAGYYPWFGYAQGRGHYDPLFAYYRWSGGDRGRWSFNDLQRRYDRFDRDGDWRGRDGDWRGRGPDGRDQRDADFANRLIASSYSDLDDTADRFRMTGLDDAARRQLSERADRFERFRQERASLEGRGDLPQAAQDALAGVTGDRDQRGDRGPGEQGRRQQVLKLPVDNPLGDAGEPAADAGRDGSGDRGDRGPRQGFDPTQRGQFNRGQNQQPDAGSAARQQIERAQQQALDARSRALQANPRFNQPGQQPQRSGQPNFQGRPQQQPGPSRSATPGASPFGGNRGGFSPPSRPARSSAPQPSTSPGGTGDGNRGGSAPGLGSGGGGGDGGRPPAQRGNPGRGR